MRNEPIQPSTSQRPHWAQLAYQFGHELGRVLCNSWLPRSTLKPPSRWLEEALAEAFAIRGLGLLAESWANNPPFPNDSAYSRSLRDYRDTLLKRYGEKANSRQLPTWFEETKGLLEQSRGLEPAEGPAIIALVRELERQSACVSDLGAVNRWSTLSALPIEEYLRAWLSSCLELRAPGLLPKRIKSLFGLA